MAEPIRVTVVSDAPLYRQGLCSLVSQPPDVVVFGQGDFKKIPSLMAGNPDVLLLDVGHAIDLAGVRDFLLSGSRHRMVVVGVGDGSEELLGWLMAGAAGYASRNATKGTLIKVIQNAMRGRLQCPPEISGRLLQWGQRSGSRRPRSLLTHREQEILQLLALKLTNKEIATRLNIELSTVKNHMHNIFEKCQVRHRWEAPLGHLATAFPTPEEKDLDPGI